MQQDETRPAPQTAGATIRRKTVKIAPMLLRARLLQSLNRGDEALPLLQKSIKKYPDDKRLAPDLCTRAG
jgi:hypothetical protein